MRFIQKMLLVLGVGSAMSLMAAGAGASIAVPQNGVEYQTVNHPQPVDSGNKVEVMEFFGYFCPHCNALDPLLADWIKKQGDKIVFKRVHVDFFTDSTLPQQKLFATLDAMGKLEELHSKVFHAVHVEHQRLATDAEVVDFAVKNGLDKQKFLDIYNSFTVRSKLNRAKQLQDTFNITGVPTIVLDGRILTSPSMSVAGLGHRVSEDDQNKAGIQVLDSLVKKLQAEKAAAKK